MTNVPSIFAAPPAGGNTDYYNDTYGSPPMASAFPIDGNNFNHAGAYQQQQQPLSNVTNMGRCIGSTNDPAFAATTTPPSAGSNHNLPDGIRTTASLRGVTVVAWTKLDPALAQELGRFVCCRTFGPVLCPCFWCHLVCLWPCLWAGKAATENAAQSQYWILTGTELKIVSLDHDQSCIPGMCKSGNVVKTVPLENITDCGLDARGTGWFNDCAGDVPMIYVDTASSCNTSGGGGGHEAVGLGLENYQWFIQQILNQRSIVKGHHQGGIGSIGAMGTQSPMAASMARPGSGKSAQERIAEIKQLKDQGIITQQEFDQKRQEIIASI